MDKEEFESKLKTVRRQKEQAEAELEAASEKWRGERRKLNSEIDRLENALSEAKESPRRSRADKTTGIDAVQVAKMQAAADEKLKNAAKEWDTERDRFKQQIARLERDVAEAIERSSNPLRAAQAVRADHDIRMNQIANEKAELERALIREKAGWEDEKLKLNAEIVKLRKNVLTGKAVPETPVPDPKVALLEKKIDELQKAHAQALAQSLEEEQQKYGALEKKIDDLQAKWEIERRQLNDHAGQLQKAYVEAQAQMQNYEAAAASNQHYEAKLEQALRERQSLEKDFQKARDDWNTDKEQLNAEIERMEQQLLRTTENRERVNSEIVDQLRKQYDQKLQEAIQQKTQLANELQSASELLETERERLSTEIAKSKEDAAKTDGGGGAAAVTGEVAQEVITAEVQRIEAMIQEIANLIDNPATELSTVIRKNVERAELDAYLKGIYFSVGRGKGL